MQACKDQHFYSTLCGRGEGVSKKSTRYTLAKRLKIVDHPLLSNVSKELLQNYVARYVKVHACIQCRL